MFDRLLWILATAAIILAVAGCAQVVYQYRHEQPIGTVAAVIGCALIAAWLLVAWIWRRRTRKQ